MIEQCRHGSPNTQARYVVGPGARLTTSVMPSPPGSPPPRKAKNNGSGEGASGDEKVLSSPSDGEDNFIFDLDEPLLPHTHLLPSLVLPNHDVAAENYYVPPVPTRVYSRPPAWQHYLVSLSISVGAIAVAIFVPKIQVIFSLLGGVCSSFLCFVFPAMCVKRLGCCTVETEGRAGMLSIDLMQWGGAAAGLFSTIYTVYTTFM